MGCKISFDGVAGFQTGNSVWQKRFAPKIAGGGLDPRALTGPKVLTGWYSSQPLLANTQHERYSYVFSLKCYDILSAWYMGTSGTASTEVVITMSSWSSTRGMEFYSRSTVEGIR